MKEIRNDFEQDGQWKYIAAVDMAFEKRTGKDEGRLCLCDVCNRELARFVHILEHPEHGRVRCGKSCAAKLLGDKNLAKQMDKKAWETGVRKEIFLSKRWKANREKGTWFLFYEGHKITIMKSKFKSESYGILLDGAQIWTWNDKDIRSVDAAKELAFDIIVAAEKRMRRSTK